MKNSYVGRTFIKPKQSNRVSAVRVKLNVLREAGAREVHMRVTAPPFLHPCYFGTDIPSKDQLIASGKTVEEVCRLIGADSLGYLEMRRLGEMAQGLPVCTACFSGEYPIAPPEEDIRGGVLEVGRE